MEVKKLEVPKINKEMMIDIIEELKYCAYTYIEDEEDQENINIYTVLGITKILIKKLDVSTLDTVSNEFIKETKKSNAEVFKK